MWNLLPLTLESGVATALALAVLALFAYSLRERRLRLATQKLAAEGQERLALISAMTSFGFWSWDSTTDEVWASTHARSILALDACAPLKGQSFLAVIHPEDRGGVMTTIKSAGPSHNTLEMELRVLGAGGETRWITAKACAHYDAKGLIQ